MEDDDIEFLFGSSSRRIAMFGAVLEEEPVERNTKWRDVRQDDGWKYHVNKLDHIGRSLLWCGIVGDTASWIGLSGRVKCGT